MKSNLFAPFLVLALVLSGCSAIGKAAGMVPQADLAEAEEQAAILQSNLTQRDLDLRYAQEQFEAAKGQVAELTAQVSDLESTNEELTGRNEDLETLICSDRVWDDFMSSGVWLPEGWFDPKYSEAYTVLERDWDFLPEMTQWTGLNQLWNTSLPGYLIIWDRQSMVWNVDEHCFILDPTLFRDLAR